MEQRDKLNGAHRSKEVTKDKEKERKKVGRKGEVLRESFTLFEKPVA